MHQTRIKLKLYPATVSLDTAAPQLEKKVDPTAERHTEGQPEASGGWSWVVRRLRWARRRMTVVGAPWQRGWSSAGGFWRWADFWR